MKAETKYVYIDGSEYPNVSYKTSATLLKKEGGSGMNRYFYAYVTSSETTNCSSSANSIASFITVKASGGDKYIYIPGDLENGGYDFKPRSGIYGNGATTLYKSFPELEYDPNAVLEEGELDEVIAGADYLTVKRSGWVGSVSYADSMRKKKDIYMLTAGSVFSRRFSGDIFDVSDGGKHPVYRYGKPMLMAIS